MSERGLTLNINTGQAEQNVDALTTSLGSLGASFVRMSAIIGGFTAISAVSNQFSQAVTNAIEYEEQIAQIQKVTSRGVATQLESELESLASDIPVARDNLAEIVEEAGRLGIEGTKNISRFTESVAKLDVATNLSAREASRNFARILTVTGTATSKIENLGSSVNALSNTMATSADEIVGGMQRASATAAQFGLRAEEIAAVSAAINEVSATARRANTRLRRVFQILQQSSAAQDFSNALEGISEKGFIKMRRNNPRELLLEIIKQFKEGGRQAQQLREALDSAGSQAIAGLSQNLSGLQEALDRSSTQFEKNTSLQREYVIQADTTAAKLQTLSNNWKNLTTTVGEFIVELEESLGLISRTEAGIEGLTAAIEGRSKDFAGIVSKQDAKDLENVIGKFDTFNGIAAQIAENLGAEGAFISENELRKVTGFAKGALKEAPKEVRDSLSDAFEGSLRFAVDRPAKRNAEELIKLLNEDIKQLAPQLQEAGKELNKQIQNGTTDQEIIPKSLRDFADSVNKEITTIGDLRAEIRKTQRATEKGLINKRVGERKVEQLKGRIKELKDETKNTVSSFEDMGNTLKENFDIELPNIKRRSQLNTIREAFGPEEVNPFASEEAIDNLARKARKKLEKVPNSFRENFRQALNSVEQDFTNTITTMVTEGKLQFDKFFESLGKQLVRQLVQQRITDPIFSAITKATQQSGGGGSGLFSSISGLFGAGGVGSSFAGFFDNGGTVPGRKGEPKMAVVHGQERILPPESNVKSTGRGQQNVEVNVINKSGNEVKTERRQSNNGEMIDVVIEAAARSVKDPGGKMNQAMRDRFNLDNSASSF